MHVHAYCRLVHVSLHDMSVQTFSRKHAALQIHEITHPDHVQIGAVQRLLHRRDYVFLRIRVILNYGQTHAVVGNGLVNAERLVKGVAKREMFVSLLLLNLEHLSHFFYYTAEHIS